MDETKEIDTLYEEMESLYKERSSKDMQFATRRRTILLLFGLFVGFGIILVYKLMFGG